jgi:hypothetical protein
LPEFADPVPETPTFKAALFVPDVVVKLTLVEGVAPAPPPRTSPPEDSTAEDTSVPAAVKPKMPPDVPPLSPVPPFGVGSTPVTPEAGTEDALAAVVAAVAVDAFPLMLIL